MSVMVSLLLELRPAQKGNTFSCKARAKAGFSLVMYGSKCCGNVIKYCPKQQITWPSGRRGNSNKILTYLCDIFLWRETEIGHVRLTRIWASWGCFPHRFKHLSWIHHWYLLLNGMKQNGKSAWLQLFTGRSNYTEIKVIIWNISHQYYFNHTKFHERLDDGIRNVAMLDGAMEIMEFFHGRWIDI